MGGYIPDSIKTKVIDSWIDGTSRIEIASQNGIGTGTVSKIVNPDSSNIVDIDMLRALSKQLRKDGVTTRDFASAVRLANRLKRLSMSVDAMDSFVELMDVHCFKTEQTVVDLISKVAEADEIASTLGVTLDELAKNIHKQLNKKDGLESEITSLKSKLTEELKMYGATKKDLDEYRKNRNKLAELKHLQDKLKEKDEVIKEVKNKLQHNSKLEEGIDSGMRKYLETEIDKYNQEFSTENPLDIEELEQIISEIHYTPWKYPEVIKLLREAVASTNKNDQDP